MRRIGIDVGGTNTDAVLIDDRRVLGAVKTPTTADVLSGIRQVLRDLAEATPLGAIDAVMIGTTHFTNAVVERARLERVAAIRIALPAARSLPPTVDWPDDLRASVDPLAFLVAGGHEYDGRELVPLDRTAIREAALRIRDAGIRSVGITALFSPLTASCEEEAADILREVLPEARITLSHTLGRIGLLERENVTLLNAALRPLGLSTVSAFAAALRDSAIDAPFFLTQNDGTIVLAEIAATKPVHSFASGPTNSMRGAAFLSGRDGAMVVDVGGTTTDIGSLANGFPREANNVVEVGGVRTLFRMPDLLPIALGGGTIVDPATGALGPRSVGYRIAETALVFGGDTLTATDIAVAAGRVEIGDRDRVRHLDRDFVAAMLRRIAGIVEDGVDRMKSSGAAAELVAVGGGAFLVPDRLDGVSEVIRVDHAGVANALGAAMAQISGEVDQIFSDMSRDAALAAAQATAEARAVEAGAEASTLKVVEVEDLPIAYLPGGARRVRARVVGDARRA